MRATAHGWPADRLLPSHPTSGCAANNDKTTNDTGGGNRDDKSIGALRRSCCNRRHCRADGEQPPAYPDCRHHRHRDRMVRLFHLRPDRAAGVRSAVLSEFDQLTATIAVFATFAVGFLARPLGGLVFGHFGDRLGRKSVLLCTLLMMGLATMGIGLLPTYAGVGVIAPVALVVLRF